MIERFSEAKVERSQDQASHKRVAEVCRGCGACAIVCPQQAIRLDRDGNGFLSAVIDETACLDCGLCREVCAKAVSDVPPLGKEQVYAAYASDPEDRAASSSGGMAYLLARRALENGLTACGAVYDYDQNHVRHICVDSEAELSRFQGSKYLQSDTSQLVDGIRTGHLTSAVVFGTPCQVAGLHIALTRLRLRSSFTLVDLFCHGVPSQLLWQNHLAAIQKQHGIKQISAVRFREGRKYVLSINASYRRGAQYDAFYYFFLHSLVMNRACYSCPFRRSSFADLRLGDFSSPKYAHLGFTPSVVIANTLSGTEILKEIEPLIELSREEYAGIDSTQDNGVRPVPLQYEQYLDGLRHGRSPWSLARSGLLLARIKGIAKSFIHFVDPSRYDQ